MISHKATLAICGVVGGIGIILSVLLSSGAAKPLMIVPALILALGLWWSWLAIPSPTASQRSAPLHSAPLHSAPGGGEQHGAMVPVQGDRLERGGASATPVAGRNGDIPTIPTAATSSQPAIEGPGHEAQNLAARNFEIAPDELTEDTSRLQCPRCGRYEGVEISADGRMSSCESCSARFRLQPYAIAYVRTFDLGMVTALDILSERTDVERTDVERTDAERTDAEYTNHEPTARIAARPGRGTS